MAACSSPRSPLHGDGGVVGTLAISYERPRFVTDAEVELLQSLADQAAIAVANARLYEELRRSEERYRFLLERSPDAAWSCDADGRFQFMADSITRLAGWRPVELVGRHFSVLVDPAWRTTAEAAWNALVRDPERPQRLRFDLVHKDGRPVPIEIHAAATVEDGRFAGAHGSVRDITGRDRVERDLLRQATELAGTQERAHLARELHDSVTQALFSMTLTTRSAELLLDRDAEAAQRKLQELRELERDALAEMRGLLFELRPRSLEQDGLVQAVRTHAAAVQGRSGLSVVVEADPIDRMSIAVEDALFRVAQEALHNVIKHAGATRVTVRIKGEPDGIRLEVADDGHGFDASQVPSGHLGLAGMRARVEQVGGRFEIRSSPHGTVLTVRAPLRAGPVPEGPPSPVRAVPPVVTTGALFPPITDR
jgi:PAS domain S-box-containing protein